ncbi:MAG: hypothetical protein R2734_17640 [Nocardioides sp.]
MSGAAGCRASSLPRPAGIGQRRLDVRRLAGLAAPDGALGRAVER